jgi:hypothetical protein
MERGDLELFERSVRHATASATGAALDAALDELGWSDALAIDPRAAVSVLFEAQGDANAHSSALSVLVGGSRGTVLPALGQWSPPGVVEAGRLRVTGVAPAGATPLLVIARDADKEVAIEVPAAQLTGREVHGIDPWLELSEITGECAAGAGEPVTGWTATVALAQLAIGHELVGVSRKMLELAREHALTRVQFGQTISGFQAIRHRLAETLIAIETAAAALDAAWQDQSPDSAAMAKALAGRGARTAARHCQQVLAGIGFTTEHTLHRYIRRVFVLDELFGPARTLTKALGDQLLATRQLPPLPPL